MMNKLHLSKGEYANQIYCATVDGKLPQSPGGTSCSSVELKHSYDSIAKTLKITAWCRDNVE